MFFFRAFDKENTGLLSVAQLAKIMKTRGEKIKDNR